MGTIEIDYEGPLSSEVLDCLTRDLGLLVESTKPFVVLSTNLHRDVPAVYGALRLWPGVRRIVVRKPAEVEVLLPAVATGHQR
ncbi:MAG: hypothetical protein Q8P31_00905 [Bacillota bacterium]|nr:hypothetical protein [Bacillota bacterium]